MSPNLRDMIQIKLFDEPSLAGYVSEGCCTESDVLVDIKYTSELDHRSDVLVDMFLKVAVEYSSPRIFIKTSPDQEVHRVLFAC